MKPKFILIDKIDQEPVFINVNSIFMIEGLGENWIIHWNEGANANSATISKMTSNLGSFVDLPKP